MQWWCSAQGIPWTWTWRAYPGVWLFMALLTVLWWRVARATPARRDERAARAGGTRAERTARPARLAAGALGLAAVWAALDWPLGTLGAGYLASAHALQFLLLAMAAPPLLLAGIRDEALRALLAGRPALLRALTWLTHPLVGMIGFTAVIVVTHVPAVVDTLMVSQLGTLALDLAWLGSGLLFWWPIVRGVPARPAFHPPAQIGYIGLGTIAHTGVAIVFLMARFPLFSIYELAPPFPGLTPINDQQLAGGIMLLLGNAIVIGIAAVVFFRWMSSSPEAPGSPALSPAPAHVPAAAAAPASPPRTASPRATSPRRPLLVLALVAGALATPRLALAQRATLERVLRQDTLANGLQLIVVENNAVPLATVEVVVRNGAFTQEPRDEGVAHLFEHMLFRGYQGAVGESFAEAAGLLTGSYNGTTSEEAVTYYLTLPSRNVAAGVRLLARLLRAPRFDQQMLDQERQVVFGESERQLGNPFVQLQQQMARQLWTTQFSRKNTIGNRDALAAVTPERLRAIFRRYYVPNNAALVVTGDVRAADIFAVARQAFGGWPRGADPFAERPIPPIPPLAGDTAVTVTADVGDVTVLLQWQGPSVGDDRAATYAADVFSDVLNAPGSRLQRELVDSGLWTAVLVNYYTLDNTGPITISGSTTADKLPAALAALRAEIARFAEPGYFTAQELELVKKQRQVGSAFGLERSSSLAQTIAFWWSVAGLDYYMGYVDNMAAQTPETVRAYARRYIVGQPSVLGILASPSVTPAVGRALGARSGAMLRALTGARSNP